MFIGTCLINVVRDSHLGLSVLLYSQHGVGKFLGIQCLRCRTRLDLFVAATRVVTIVGEKGVMLVAAETWLFATTSVIGSHSAQLYCWYKT